MPRARRWKLSRNQQVFTCLEVPIICYVYVSFQEWTPFFYQCMNRQAGDFSTVASIAKLVIFPQLHLLPSWWFFLSCNFAKLMSLPFVQIYEVYFLDAAYFSQLCTKSAFQSEETYLYRMGWFLTCNITILLFIHLMYFMILLKGTVSAGLEYMYG